MFHQECTNCSSGRTLITNETLLKALHLKWRGDAMSTATDNIITCKWQSLYNVIQWVHFGYSHTGKRQTLHRTRLRCARHRSAFERWWQRLNVGYDESIFAPWGEGLVVRTSATPWSCVRRVVCHRKKTPNWEERAKRQEVRRQNEMEPFDQWPVVTTTTPTLQTGNTAANPADYRRFNGAQVEVCL